MSASNEVANSLPAHPRSKTCEACGAIFSCGAPGGPCWCDAVQISAVTLAELRAKYADCLCPKCLAGIAGAENVHP